MCTKTKNQYSQFAFMSTTVVHLKWITSQNPKLNFPERIHQKRKSLLLILTSYSPNPKVANWGKMLQNMVLNSIRKIRIIILTRQYGIQAVCEYGNGQSLIPG